MGIRFDPTPPKGDLDKATASFVKAVAKVIKLDFIDSGETLLEAARALRPGDLTLEQRAWALWRDSITLAFTEICGNHRLTNRPTRPQFKTILTHILRSSGDYALAQKTGLLHAHLSRPQDIPLYREVRESLPALIRQFDTEHRISDDELRRKLDQAFILAFPHVWIKSDGYFNFNESALGGPAGQIIERHYEWQRYYDLLRRDVEEKPLFGQEDGGATLEDIFVPLRCYWRELPKEVDREKRGPVTVHVRMLQQELHAWLSARKATDPLRVVTGGPGCGKSSTAKVFARDVARAGDWNVYVIPLQGLRVDAEPEAIIETYTGFMKGDADHLSTTPLAHLRDDLKPLLLIFDGLDEVARPGVEGDEATRKFVSNIKSWLGIKNQSSVRVFSLVLGRPQAAEMAADFASLQNDTVLHTAPLHKFNENHEAVVGRSDDRKTILEVPETITIEDQRLEFWQKYHAVKPDCPPEPPEEILGNGLHDLTVEPLLLYLLIFSGLAGERWREAAENRNRVYEEIFNNLHDRDVAKPGAELKQGITERGDFFILMECFGLAAWKGGGRTGNTEQFQRLRDTVYAPEKKRLFKDLEQADLDNVALQFYTRKSGAGEQSYDFIHKSFGEYLTARALIEAGEKLLRGYENDGDEEAFSRRWLKLTGERRIAREVFIFLIDEARLRAKRMPDDPADYMKARDRIEHLTGIANWVLANGFPAHTDLGFNEGGLSWREREAAQANAESALFAIIHVWGLIAFPEGKCGDNHEQGWEPGAIRILWPDERAAKSLIERFRAHPNFRGSARLTSNDRWRSHDIESEFLRAMNLASARLSSLSFNGLWLEGTIISNGRFYGSQLTATMRQAKLEAAEFGGGSAEGLDISGAKIHFADLSRVSGLGQHTIQTAHGNSRTLLPDGMTRPDHWPETKYETWEEALAAGDPDG